MFKGSVHRTEKNLTKPWTGLFFSHSYLNLGLFLLPVTEFQKYFKTIQKTGFSQLQSVELSCASHTLATTFITLNWVFGSSKTVKKWEKYNQIHFCTNNLLCDLYKNDFNSNSLKFSSFCFIQLLVIEISSKVDDFHNLQMSHAQCDTCWNWQYFTKFNYTYDSRGPIVP